MSSRKLTIGITGLGFGKEFVPIYLDHPDIEHVVLCDSDSGRLRKTASDFKIKDCETDYNDLLARSDIDAVHLISGIPDHASQTVSALETGKHCACTVPMAASIKDIERIIRARQKSGLNYMMMETAVYTRQFLFAHDMHSRNEFGRIQFLRGAHYQDMEGWPPYWAGLPPMWYATHAVSPLLALADTRAVSVRCLGSGTMREELRSQYGNPFPIETAVFELEKNNLAAEVTRSLFHGVRPYMESFTVYGEDACYEWQMEGEPPILFKAAGPAAPGSHRPVKTSQPVPPDRADLLPPEAGKYTQRFVYGENEKHQSFVQGGGHHGSHPHMVHEFVRSIIEKRNPWIDAVRAADWTAAGICAHESAMKGGEAVRIPDWG